MNFIQAIAAARRVPVAPSGIITTNLLYHVDPDNSASYPGSGLTWYDLANSYNFALAGGMDTSYNSGSPSYFDLDGLNDYATLGDQLDMGTNSYTLFAWISADATTTTSVFAGKSAATTGPGRYHASLNGAAGFIRANFYPNSTIGAFLADGTTDVRGAGWVNVCVVWDRSGDMEVWVNNTKEAAVNISAHSSYNMQNSYAYLLGCFNSGSGVPVSLPFNGKMGQVAMYNAALTPSQIAQNWNATRGIYGL
jgi:hypothetical protein